MNSYGRPPRYTRVKAIVVSGYSDDSVLAHFRAYGFKGKAAKPFDFKELARVLHAVLAEA